MIEENNEKLDAELESKITVLAEHLLKHGEDDIYDSAIEKASEEYNITEDEIKERVQTEAGNLSSKQLNS